MYRTNINILHIQRDLYLVLRSDKIVRLNVSFIFDLVSSLLSSKHGIVNHGLNPHASEAEGRLGPRERLQRVAKRAWMVARYTCGIVGVVHLDGL